MVLDQPDLLLLRVRELVLADLLPQDSSPHGMPHLDEVEGGGDSSCENGPNWEPAGALWDLDDLQDDDPIEELGPESWALVQTEKEDARLRVGKGGVEDLAPLSVSENPLREIEGSQSIHHV